MPITRWGGLDLGDAAELLATLPPVIPRSGGPAELATPSTSSIRSHWRPAAHDPRPDIHSSNRRGMRFSPKEAPGFSIWSPRSTTAVAAPGPASPFGRHRGSPPLDPRRHGRGRGGDRRPARRGLTILLADSVGNTAGALQAGIRRWVLVNPAAAVLVPGPLNALDGMVTPPRTSPTSWPTGTTTDTTGRIPSLVADSHRRWWPSRPNCVRVERRRVSANRMSRGALVAENVGRRRRLGSTLSNTSVRRRLVSHGVTQT